MILKFDNDRPIFLQIADSIEDDILQGVFLEETQIPSITEFSLSYNINPATALKGITMLVESGVLYKKRGVGMFVARGANEILKEKRKEQFFSNYVTKMIEESKRLNFSKDELIKIIERGYEE